MRNALLTTEPKQIETYRGITMHADTGLHEQIAVLVDELVPRGSRVLDVGAGAGAFSQRLADAGYEVTAVDVDESKWMATDVRFRVLDVADGLKVSVDTEYDAIFCLEIIEHLENPFEFMRDTIEVVRPGGLMFLSTPNVTSFLSRALFFLRGELHQFGPADLSYGHITPMTFHHLETAASRAGWRVVRRVPGGYLPVFDLSSLTIRSLATNVLSGVAALVGRGEKRGWCLVYVLQRPDDSEA